MTFAERLREARVLHGWSQYRLSKVAGVPQQVISRLESGERSSENLSCGVASKLAKALELSLDDFIAGETGTEQPVATCTE